MFGFGKLNNAIYELHKEIQQMKLRIMSLELSEKNRDVLDIARDNLFSVKREGKCLGMDCIAVITIMDGEILVTSYSPNNYQSIATSIYEVKQYVDIKSKLSNNVNKQ